MSFTLDQIKQPIEQEMQLFEQKFRQSMQSSVPLLDRIMHYIVKRKGKQMRPMFVFLTAGMSGGITESTYRAASLIELLHTATLVHDDVVDDSNLRRGFFSINALWKNKIAVLVGDYLLSKGLLLSVDHEEFNLLKIVSTAVRRMSEGELLQIEKARKLDITEEVYYDIIRAKTASLIASCCATGAASAGKDEAFIRRMHDFGEAVGIAFQIKDDLFDYEQATKTGKPRGVDIKEHKMTLPLIHALQVTDRSSRKFIMDTVRNHSEDKKRVEEVVTRVIDAGGFKYAQDAMITYRDKAFEYIRDIEDGRYKESLIRLVQFTIERNN